MMRGRVEEAVERGWAEGSEARLVVPVDRRVEWAEWVAGAEAAAGPLLSRASVG